MRKRAIVIGATGLIGKALVDQLAEADHIGEIVTLTRRPYAHPSSIVHNQPIDFDRLKEHAHLFRADFLFSCLGTTRKQAGSIAAQYKVDHDYQLKAAQLASKNGVNHYLLVSSSGANHLSRNSYMRMKGELELKIKDLPFERISIFQPSLLLGQRTEFRLGEKIGSWAMRPLRIVPGFKRFRPIRGEQVAAKMVQVSGHDGKPLEWFCLDDIFIHSR